MTMAPMAAARSRDHLHARMTLGERVADKLAAALGSWRFILTQNWFVGMWIAWNTFSPFKFDPPPFIGLNLLFSWQASNTGPVLQMTGNRQATIDRKRDDHEAEEVEQLWQINQQQLEILTLLRRLVDDKQEESAAA